MEENEPDKTKPWILNKMIQISERLLDSDETANILITILVLLAFLPALGIGVTLTRATAPTHQVEISN